MCGRAALGEQRPCLIVLLLSEPLLGFPSAEHYRGKSMQSRQVSLPGRKQKRKGRVWI